MPLPLNVQLPCLRPAYGLDFARREFPLRALQAQKWRARGSRTFGAAWSTVFLSIFLDRAAPATGPAATSAREKVSRDLWEGRVVVILVFKVLQFDVLA